MKPITKRIITNDAIAIGICVLSFVAARFGGSIIAYVTSILYICYAMCLPLNKRAWFVAGALTNTKGLCLVGVSVSVVICALSVVSSLCKRKKVETDMLAGVCCYMFYSLHFCFRQAGFIYGIVFPLKMASVLLFFYFLFKDEKIYENGDRFVVEMTNNHLMGALGATVGSFTGIGRLAVYGNDPNALGLQMAFVFSVLCVMRYRTNALTFRKYVFFTVICLLIGTLTGSRMFFVLLVLIILSTILMNVNKISKIAWFVSLILVAACLFISSPIGKRMLITLTERQDALIEQNNILNGRTELWSAYVAYLKENISTLFFGCGDYTITGIPLVAHNMLIEGVVSYGIFGLAILFFAYLKVKDRLFRNIKFARKSWFVALPLFIVLVGNIVLHDLTNIYNTCMLFLGLFIIASLDKARNNQPVTEYSVKGLRFNYNDQI